MKDGREKEEKKTKNERTEQKNPTREQKRNLSELERRKKNTDGGNMSECTNETSLGAKT